VSKQVLVIVATALLALAGLATRASAKTIIDWTTVSLEAGGIPVPVSIPCGGERVSLGGTVSVHLLVRDDARLEYHVNAEDAVGRGSATGAPYHLVGAASGEARAGDSFSAELILVGPSPEPVPVELHLRTTLREPSGLPDVSLASIRVVQACDPGTLTLNDTDFGGFGDYTLALVGTALEPGSNVAIYGVTSRGGAPYNTDLLGTVTVQVSGTLATLLYPQCSDGQFLYATGTSASGDVVTSNTYVALC
jgi:hypothetical protein